MKHEIDQQLIATIADIGAEPDLAIVEQGLDEHASRNGIEARHHTPLVVMLRHEDKVSVGGLVGSTVWGWLQIKQLWIADEYRHRGLGRKLVLLAETESAKRGCHHAMLDTFDFQALSFYEELGYEVFGRLDDFPTGHVRYFLAKKLAPSQSY